MTPAQISMNEIRIRKRVDTARWRSLSS